MPKLIKADTLADNPWVMLDKESGVESVTAMSGDHLIVPLALWLDHKAALQATGKTFGVWVDSDENVEDLVDDLHALPLVALNFPSFRDGRAYSSAAILRQRLKYQGELRAVGDVLRDQLFYMKQCGFNSFDIPDEVDVDDAMSAFADFTENYQSTTEKPVPLFKRR